MPIHSKSDDGDDDPRGGWGAGAKGSSATTTMTTGGRGGATNIGPHRLPMLGRWATNICTNIGANPSDIGDQVMAPASESLNYALLLFGRFGDHGLVIF